MLKYVITILNVYFFWDFYVPILEFLENCKCLKIHHGHYLFLKIFKLSGRPELFVDMLACFLFTSGAVCQQQEGEEDVLLVILVFASVGFLWANWSPPMCPSWKTACLQIKIGTVFPAVPETGLVSQSPPFVLLGNSTGVSAACKMTKWRIFLKSRRMCRLA